MIKRSGEAPTFCRLCNGAVVFSGWNDPQTIAHNQQQHLSVSAAAVIIHRRKRFIRRFRELGAISPDRAIPFAEAGLRRSWIFDQMVSRGVFVTVGPEHFYMNEEAAAAFLVAQRKRALVAAAILLVLFLIYLLISYTRT